MNFKAFVESYVKLLEEHPELGELEVWQYSDAEGNSVLPVYDSSNIAYIDKGQYGETDEFVQDAELTEHLEWLEVQLDEFLEANKQVILIG
jgi:hypothetical protein